MARRKRSSPILEAETTYGPDSSEYEMVGGTRTSERKKRSSKKGGTGTPTT